MTRERVAVPIYSRRTEAKLLLKHFTDAITGTSVFLDSPPDIGTTTFLMSDVQPHAAERGYLPIYIDLKENPEAPAEALRQGVARGIMFLNKSGGPLAKTWDAICRLFTSDVEKLGIEIAPVSIELRDKSLEGPGRVVSKGGEELPGLLRLLAERSKARDLPVMLLIDHADLMPTPIATMMKSALMQNYPNGRLQAMFAVSTPAARDRLYGTAGSPFDGFCHTFRLNPPGESFIATMNQHILVPRGINIPKAELKEVLRAVNHRPAAFLRVLEALTHKPKLGIGPALARVQSSETNPSSSQNHARLWSAITPLQRLLLRDIAMSRYVFSEERLASYAESRGMHSPMKVDVVSNNLDDLVARGVLSRDLNSYAIRNPSLRSWAAGKGPFSAAAGQGEHGDGLMIPEANYSWALATPETEADSSPSIEISE